MSVDDSLDRLEKELERARAEIDHLAAKEQIRDCIFRYSRGLDRIDEAALRSAFHPDAIIDFAPSFCGSPDEFIPLSIAHQRAQFQAHHLVGNIIIQIEGYRAFAESYGLARHKNKVHGRWVDQLIALRLLDVFEKRNGVWKIVRRKQVTDWARAAPITPGSDQIYEEGLLEKGARNPSDASYELQLGGVY